MRRAIEFFSGLGGWRLALAGRAEVVAAYDISPAANRTYALNHGHEPLARELATLPARQLEAHRADTWVMSPPCQPFCRMGNRSDLEDLRSRAFIHLMGRLGELRPERLLLENVSGFEGSRAHGLLHETLARAGYRHRELQLCPTRFGIPNQRPRYFLAASLGTISSEAPPEDACGPLRPYLDDPEDAALYLDEATETRHCPGLDLVRPEDTRSACFIGGYGRRFVGSGSFLLTGEGIRRFSPAEVSRLMGLPAEFRFPDSVDLNKRYKLLGNSLSIPVARWVAGLPG